VTLVNSKMLLLKEEA